MLALAAGISLSARTEAWANADMNPSLMPWSFRIWSLYLERISISEDMSISLKVVSDAAVFCDSFKRSEIRRRMRFIFTRVSFLLPGVAAAGGGVDSGLGSFALGGADFDSVFGGGGTAFRSSGDGGEVSLGFSTAWSPAFFGSSGAVLS